MKKTNNEQFNLIITELRSKIKEAEGVVSEFTLTSQGKDFIWLLDHMKIIGCDLAHYELINIGEVINVDIHFEGKKKKDRDQFSIINLPPEFEWIKWEQSKSIRLKEDFSINDVNIVDKLIKGIQKTEAYLGDAVREILRKAMPINLNNISYGPLNQILFGPPGTGKTYNTINKALEILGENLNGKNRKDIKGIFDEKLQSGQIVFTTFHQSLNYEDFIEGIKPKTLDGGVIYEVESGIFRKLCETAKSKSFTTDNFESAYGALLEEIKTSGGKLVLETLHHAKEFTIYVNSKNNLRFHANTDIASEGVVKKEVIETYLKNGAETDWASYTRSIAAHMIEKHGYKKKEKNEQKNYVLIIDEINRGNVSQIFGELITLIEDDKRIGKDEELTVTLPYSKEKFGVPSNLYIIGTMNTADRSVEALDAALRRRFSFVEMAPRPELLPSEYQDLLRTINKRIEKLLDKDHQIGHSYFISVTSLNDLKQAFQNKIIPLLQEYFFGDYGKIGLVLGEGFFEPEESTEKTIFADFRGYDATEFGERIIYKLHHVTEMSDSDFQNALTLLLTK